jgi:hypothetical protein
MITFISVVLYLSLLIYFVRHQRKYTKELHAIQVQFKLQQIDKKRRNSHMLILQLLHQKTKKRLLIITCVMIFLQLGIALCAFVEKK